MSKLIALENALSSDDQKVVKEWDNFALLIEELRQRNLPETTSSFINAKIESLNLKVGTHSISTSEIRKVKSAILAHLEKELKMVPKNYYRNIWMPIGLASFGLPLGAAVGMALDNMAFIGIGMPFGLLLGMAVGMAMDKKVAEKGNQLQYSLY